MTSRFPQLALGFKLSYPVRREYSWFWFSLSMAVVGLFTLFVLIPINVAFTGYQTIVTQSPDPNILQSHWLSYFRKTPKPGSLCHPHNFTMGDTLSTNSSLFEWTLSSADTADPLVPFFSYKGAPLRTCDVHSIIVDASAQTFAVSAYAVVRCLGPDLPILMRTSYTPWGGGTGSYFINKLRLNVRGALDRPPNVFDGLGLITGVAVVNEMLVVPPIRVDSDFDDMFRRLWIASDDLIRTMTDTYMLNNTTPYAFAVQAGFNLCPVTVQGLNNCTLESTYAAPQNWWSFELAVSHKPGVPDPREAEADVRRLYGNVIWNLVQIVHAAVRFDIGYILPNNIITNDSAILIILRNISVSSSLVQNLETPISINWTYPLEPPNPSIFNAAYDCDLSYPKGPGEMVIAVLVATSSMFTTGWGLAMALATYFVTKRSDSNVCATHQAEPIAPLTDPEQRRLVSASTNDLKTSFESLRDTDVDTIYETEKKAEG